MLLNLLLHEASQHRGCRYLERNGLGGRRKLIKRVLVIIERGFLWKVLQTFAFIGHSIQV
jgi:hypothetical protein